MQKQKLGKLAQPAVTVSSYDDQTEDAIEYTETVEMGLALHRGERFHGYTHDAEAEILLQTIHASFTS